jgi:hypothetical protein
MFTNTGSARWGAGDGRRPLRSKRIISLHVSHAKREGGGKGKIICIRQTYRHTKNCIGIKTAMVFEIGVAGGCFSLSLSKHNQDLYIDVSSGPQKKVCLFRKHTFYLCKRGRRQVAKKGCVEVLRCFYRNLPTSAL